jgi:hypothetical protein
MALATSNSKSTPFEEYLDLGAKYGGGTSYRFEWADGYWMITETADHQPISNELKKKLNIQWFYCRVLNEDRKM